MLASNSKSTFLSLWQYYTLTTIARVCRGNYPLNKSEKMSFFSIYSTREFRGNFRIQYYFLMILDSVYFHFVWNTWSRKQVYWMKPFKHDRNKQYQTCENGACGGWTDVKKRKSTERFLFTLSDWSYGLDDDSKWWSESGWLEASNTVMFMWFNIESAPYNAIQFTFRRNEFGIQWVAGDGGGLISLMAVVVLCMWWGFGACEDERVTTADFNSLLDHTSSWSSPQ